MEKKKTQRELEIRQAAVDHEWPVVYDDIFAEGAEWADNHPNWTRADVELPPNTISGMSDKVICACGEEVILAYYDYMNHWWTKDSRSPAIGITHWMPLPAPPRKD